jgi:hypothetical protein
MYQNVVVYVYYSNGTRLEIVAARIVKCLCNKAQLMKLEIFGAEDIHNKQSR